MNYNTTALGAFTVVGVSLRASNQKPQEIGKLWQRFYAQDIVSRIPARKSEDIYSVYSDYEGDHTKSHTLSYTLVIGCAVSDGESLPEGLVSRTVPAAKYAVIPAGGKQPDSVIAAWQQVWSSNLARAFSADFELYGSKGSSPPDQEANLYVAIR